MARRESEAIPLPDLMGNSEILTEFSRISLIPHLPRRAQDYPWRLVYSTNAHGFSLKNLYRKMRLAVDPPALLIVKDSHQHVFGAVISCCFRMSEHFYGTGECFLFSFTPTFRVHKWNGDNQHFVRGQLENLAIGSGGGTYGLWLDEDFYHGRTEKCSTFDNEPLCPCGDFIVQNLEAWCFY